MSTCPAHAKINLSLEITGKRADGYHELVSVMQTVTLADTLRVEPADSLNLTCSDPALAGSSNLALRAAAALAAYAGRAAQVSIRLDKRIPVAAGLGGGSSDAAACLAALSRLWRLPLSCDELVSVGARLGSDVPFFLYGGIALVRGRGEKVRRIRRPVSAWYLLVKPPIAVSTASVFRALAPGDWTDGSHTVGLGEELRSLGFPQIGINGLQSTLFRLYPVAERCFHDVQALAPGRAIVTGSGPTVVAIFRTRDDAERASARLEPRGYWRTVCQDWQPEEGEMPCE